jgi:hypothetical protein
MIIYLSSDCPALAGGDPKHLYRLFATLQNGGHVIASPTPAQLESLLPGDVWRVWADQIKQSYRLNANRAGLLKPAPCEACRPLALIQFCELPVLLLVENATTDGGFFGLALAKLRPHISAAFSGVQPRLRVENGGGAGELGKEIRRHSDRYCAVRPSGTAPARVVAVADSDAKAPGERTSNTTALLKATAETGAALHVLRKRTIENYVPDDALRAYAAKRTDKAAAVELVVSLTGPARDHYPMKRGLSAKDQATGLYPSQTPVEVGLDDFIADFLADFSHTVTGRGLRERDHDGDLERLLDLLEENL